MGLTKEQAFPSKWLKAADVPATGIDMTIEAVVQEEVDYGKGPELATNVTFEEFPKPLGLNATNWDSIEELHGPDSDGWIGKKVRLYRAKTRNPQGATVPCVRIQPPTAGPAAPKTDKDIWGAFYQTMDQTQQANVKAVLGGSPTSWMAKAEKDIHACIAFVKAAFKIGAEPTTPPLDDIPFE